MMNFFSTRLSFTPISDLHRMTEAVFQEMFNSYFLDPELGYLGNYFSQLGLLTDADQPVSATGRQYGNRSTRKGKSKEQPKVLAGLGRFGYMDSFGCSFGDLHPGRAFALELKNISLHSIFRAMYKDDEECSKAVNGIPGKDPADHFRKTCLEKIEELDKMSMAQLLQLHYHFHDGKNSIVRPVSALLAEAEVQLKSYMNAIARGEATNGKEGITNAEKRVRVTKNTDVPPDEVIGFVVCAVGQRIITIPVEPDIQNTQYQYSERRGWKTNWH
ncbi:hypothetical protein B0H11DRAFT_310110 [Mycena galericulata]|nr:hypothetical protein B0H11DRAFT_310110 [Mycena galericulata]